MATYQIETEDGAVYEIETDDIPAMPAETPGMGESAVRGAAQGLTLGHADELTGAMESLFSDKSYEQARDESRANYKAAHDAHPVISGITEAAGSIPGYLAATAVTGGNPVAGAVLAGAVQGEGGSDEASIGGVAKDAAVGGVVGAVAGKAGEMVSGALARPAMKTLAEEQAAKAAGATMQDFNNVGADKLRAAGRTMLDNKMLTPLADSETIAASNDALNQQAGQTIGDFLKRMTAQGEVADPKMFVDQLEILKGQLTKGGTGGHNARIMEAVDTAIDTIKGYGDQPMTFELANHVKGLLQKAANWRVGEDSLIGETNRQVAGKFRKMLDTALEAVPENPKAVIDPNNPVPVFEDFKAAKKTFGDTEIVGDLLNKRTARDLGNSALGPLEMIAGAAGSGNPAARVAQAGAWKMMRRYGNQNIALAADWILKNENAAMQQLGEFGPSLVNAAKKGPSALAVTHYVLSQQNPTYRSMYEEDQN